MINRSFSGCPATVFSLSLCLLTCLGCGGGGEKGPALATVQGKITLDGQPLPEATVEFAPTSGRPSTGVTNSDGTYQLNYTGTQKGAIVGENYTVKISTGREAVVSEGEKLQDAVPEKVPAKYNTQTELKATIQPKTNTLDFDLTGK